MSKVVQDIKNDSATSSSLVEKVAREFTEIAENYIRLNEQASLIGSVALEIASRIQRGGLVMFCGNGGSAADSQHLAAELQGRFLKERDSLASIALTGNSSTITAISNDYGFEEVFRRQVEGLGKEGDVLIGISTSGNSKNVIAAMKLAREKGIYVIALTGASGGAMAEFCDAIIRVPSAHTARIQEMHIGVGHVICGLIEDELF